ncbi:DNA-3-methyladenine glycosylase I [Sphingobacterium sp. CZ-2]|uniref:DNA-3-methyladenine glycosylase I n=1 Tax=Sphingobacterium sp. CZ-2 TaxID=2557994 RepID=UPI001FD71D1E|nr:DNA-3-methyladenine glycosylase I [Sphingobacterium sp. CZ-2]
MGLEIENMAEDKIIRCGWCGEDSLYQKYHDEEWGKVVKDDATLFEFLILESAQAGLSWITILRKREGYRNAFANFDYHKIAEFTDEDVERILQDPGVIRNRGKINSSINNAKIFMAIQKEFGSFYNYLYSFMPNQEPIINQLETLKGAPTTTAISDAISKDLKKRGMKFFGSTTCYAYMQAVGMVNDHLLSCSFRS